MVVVPLTKPADIPDAEPVAPQPSSALGPVSMVGAGALAASALLVLSGKRRAGVVAAATGTALLLLDQQDTLRAWWNAIPGYIADVQGLLNNMQNAVETISEQRQKLHQILHKSDS